MPNIIKNKISIFFSKRLIYSVRYLGSYPNVLLAVPDPVA